MKNGSESILTTSMIEGLTKEIKFKTARSSGPGGQNVNKVETAVFAFWQVHDTNAFTSEEKVIIAASLSNKINSEGVLQVHASTHRTQLQNKQSAREKIINLVEQALTPKKVRKKTAKPKAAILKRLDNKKIQSEKKSNRGKVIY